MTNAKDEKTGLRVVLISQSLPRVSQPLIDSKHNVVGVIESAPRNYKKTKMLRDLVSFFRTSKWLNINYKKSLKGYCNKKNIDYKFMTNGGDIEIEAWLKTLKPDVIVVFGMSLLLKENIFSIPASGTINLHPSYLPEYRGPNPDFWQYINLEMNPGATVHYIDKGEDTGDIILQDRKFIDLGVKSPERLDKLVGELGFQLILSALEQIQKGKVISKKQPNNSPTSRARNLESNEHCSIIDWKLWPIEKIWHILRGTECWLNAIQQPSGIFKGQRWIIEEFMKCEMKGEIAGRIYREDKRRYLATLDGKIYLTVSFSLKSLIISFLK